jgi:hypothetical protein
MENKDNNKIILDLTNDEKALLSQYVTWLND